MYWCESDDEDKVVTKKRVHESSDDDDIIDLTADKADNKMRDDYNGGFPSSSSEDEDLQTTLRQQRKKVRQRKSSKKKARVSKIDWSSDDEEEIPDSFSVTKNPPSNQEKQRFISAVLKKQKFGFQLMPHQFEGALFSAGLPSDWPQNIINNSMISTLKKATYIKSENDEDAKHAILADEMGLGKTVQTLAGCELRRAISEAKGLKPLMNLIVSPNKGVQDQWEEHIVKCHRTTIQLQGAKRESLLREKICDYALITRYQFAAIFMSASELGRNKTSAFFPGISSALLQKLRMLHDSQNDPNKFFNDLAGKYQAPELQSLHAELTRKKNHDKGNIMRKLINECSNDGHQPIFDMFIIDEAHLCKNDTTFWSIAAAIIGNLKAVRYVPITGTLYSNRLRDIANIIKYGDGKHTAAKEKFFQRATIKIISTNESEENEEGQESSLGPASNDDIAQATRRWRRLIDDDDNDCGPLHYLSRKKDIVLKGQIPNKYEFSILVSIVKPTIQIYTQDPEQIAANINNSQSGELKLYIYFESLLVEALCEFVCAAQALSSNPSNPRMFGIMNIKMKKFMAMAQLSRGSLIHPLLPCDGRSCSKFYLRKPRGALTRSNLNCALCRSSQLCDLAEGAVLKRAREVIGKTKLGQKQNDPAADDLAEKFSARLEKDDDALDNEIADDRENEIKDKKLTCILPKPYCELGHGVHEKCLRSLYGNSALTQLGCPLCLDISKRTKLGMHSNETANPKLYCTKGPFGGFAMSTKIQKTLDIIRDAVLTPKKEKVIVYSFFKGSLDLIQAIIETESEFMSIETLRYDGDTPQCERGAILNEFSTSKRANVLLATVHSAGVGLNICAASTIIFTDRWWNPNVHDQAMDRCHRIGQSREVNVHFIDAQDTIDEAMREVNKIKKGNGKVILADHSEIAAAGAGGPKWRELAGVLKNSIDQYRHRREVKLGIHHGIQLTFSDLRTPKPSLSSSKVPHEPRKSDKSTEKLHFSSRTVPKRQIPSSSDVIDLISDDESTPDNEMHAQYSSPSAKTTWTCSTCSFIHTGPLASFCECCQQCGVSRPF